MSKQGEEAYVLIGVLLLAVVISVVSIYFTYFIQREYEIIKAQQDKIAERFIITGIEEIIKNEVEKEASEKLKKNNLTKQDLSEFKKQINNYYDEIDLAGEQFEYQIKEVFDLNAKVNLNQVKAEKLKLLPGVGETLSQRIVDNRKYNQLNELKILEGIGETTFGRIKSFATVYGSEKININTANHVAWDIINKKLEFKLSDYIFSNKRYSDFEELLAEIDDEEKRNKLKTKGQATIKFNSNLLAIKYEIVNLESGDKFNGERVIEF